MSLGRAHAFTYLYYGVYFFTTILLFVRVGKLEKKNGDVSARGNVKWRKHEMATEQIFDLFHHRGFRSINEYLGRVGYNPFRFGTVAMQWKIRKYTSPLESLQAVEVRVEILSSGSLALGLGGLRIKIALVSKKGRWLGIGKEDKKFEFHFDPDEYIDDELKVQDEALQQVLDSYFQTMGLPLLANRVKRRVDGN